MGTPVKVKRWSKTDRGMKAEEKLDENLYDLEAWNVLIREAQSGMIERGRELYERLLKVFPLSGRFWRTYVEHEVVVRLVLACDNVTCYNNNTAAEEHCLPPLCTMPLFCPAPDARLASCLRSCTRCNWPRILHAVADVRTADLPFTTSAPSTGWEFVLRAFCCWCVWPEGEGRG
eukprot:scpid104056/ scgid6622/ Cleavage stimulation factor subunit 3; CF-1 77 kDa subunit; Cleavage stimulation factor 77 kDa subunit